MENNIDKNIEEIKRGTYGLNKVKNADGFKTGAIFGFFIGAFSGWIFRGKPLRYGLIGMVAFGYVGFKISEMSESKTNFINFSKQKV